MCRVVPLRVGFLRVGFLRVGFVSVSLAGSGWQPLPSRASCRFFPGRLRDPCALSICDDGEITKLERILKHEVSFL